ncbi:hypothetical protein [Arcticibacter sp.]|uniref:glucuronyl esterase domain-containing protein n=1 Tax=Arcticibacter sp. TaxID=1872630 RepID=UPI0038910E22
MLHSFISLLGITTLVLSSLTGSGDHEQKTPLPAKCPVPAMPSFSSLPNNAKLPDPFTFMNGSRMKKKKEWDCRRAEIATLAQEFVYGYKPQPAYDASSGSFSDDKITVTVNDNGKTIAFTCSITYPETGNRPFPAMIGVGASNLNNRELLKMGVAIINFPNNKIAEQMNGASRGKGLFYEMYGNDHSASAMMAWAWGVSRLIDALEKTPAAGIDPARLGITGCSRNGKGALTAGAFEERIKLTVPQEPGAGGAASWRVSDAQKAAGKNVQTLSQIVGENVWFRSDFGQFGKVSDRLPIDQHMIAALCAPRALLFLENTSMEWLSPASSWITANAAHKVWEALGIPDKMGFSQVGGHPHCALPDSQMPELRAYVMKFMVGNSSDDTVIMKTDSGVSLDEERWVDWSIPRLK